PVLAVPPNAPAAPELPFRNVLVATDFSAASLAAIQAALPFIGEQAATTLLHVIDDPDEHELFVARPYDVHHHAAEREASVRDTLAEVVRAQFGGRRAPAVRVVHG